MRDNPRTIRGSPFFRFSNSAAIAASGELLIDFEETTDFTSTTGSNKIGKYLPLNTAQFRNTSGVDVEIHLNQDRGNVVDLPNNAIATLKAEEGIGLRSVRILNLSSSTAATADTIKITVSKASEVAKTSILGGLLRS